MNTTRRREPGARLTEKQVVEIRWMREHVIPPISFRKIAAHYGVSHTAVRRAAQGRTWKHVGATR